MGARSSAEDIKSTENTYRLYDNLAWLWPFWGGPEENTDYCKHVIRLLREQALIPIRSLLKIGCGGGKNVFPLKDHYEVSGLDLSPRMLALAKELNPTCEFLQGDMRSFCLDRTLDAILMDDTVSYMACRGDLKSAFVAAWRHLNPGGIKETFVQNRTVATTAVGKTKPTHVEVVFIENDYDPNPTDDHYEGTKVYLIREDGKLRIETDHHILGLFTLDVRRETLTGVGFTIRQEKYVEGGKEYVTLACLKPR